MEDVEKGLQSLPLRGRIRVAGKILCDSKCMLEPGDLRLRFRGKIALECPFHQIDVVGKTIRVPQGLIMTKV
jgi:hypothetical protein